MPVMTKPLIDIGANLTSSVFKDDFDAVLQRATEQGLSHIILTGTSVENSRYACELASQYPDLLSAQQASILMMLRTIAAAPTPNYWTSATIQR